MIEADDDFLSDAEMREIFLSLEEVRQGNYYSDNEVSLMISRKKE